MTKEQQTEDTKKQESEKPVTKVDSESDDGGGEMGRHELPPGGGDAGDS
jgi:hypothetical protein